jgi:hypothetical protein
LHLVVEYTDDSFRTLYTDDLTESLYADQEDMRDHFTEIHDYVGIDFAELEVFEDLFVAAGDVRALTTHMDHATVVRLLVGEVAGLLFTLDPDVDVTAVIDAVEDALDR